jgi:glyoxylase-like metal-dependent hydrolase (beta-lactamase superfamily II)
MTPIVTAFFDEATNTLTYVVQEPQGKACAVIDSVLDFDYASGRTDTRSADAVIDFIRTRDLRLEWILETHVHADHLSAAPYIQERLGGQIGIGERITMVQDTFGKIFNEGTRFQRDGSQFDRLFREGDSLMIGQMRADVLHTPGHTPACLTYVIGDAAFVGDTLFMPDFGTARCDFPGGSAETMWDSIQKILALPDPPASSSAMTTRPKGATNTPGKPRWAIRRRPQQAYRRGQVQGEDFVRMRTERDAQLAMPRLIIPSLAGQHARRPDARARGEREKLSEGADQRAVTCLPVHVVETGAMPAPHRRGAVVFSGTGIDGAGLDLGVCRRADDRLAGAMYLLVNGRMMGVSGIFGGLLDRTGWSTAAEKLAFLSGPCACAGAGGAALRQRRRGSPTIWAVIVAAACWSAWARGWPMAARRGTGSAGFRAVAAGDRGDGVLHPCGRAGGRAFPPCAGGDLRCGFSGHCWRPGLFGAGLLTVSGMSTRSRCRAGWTSSATGTRRWPS